MTLDSERTEAARAYYDSIDQDNYDKLASLLTPEFTHQRSDQTLAGRERFVQFMRDERPMTDTTHVVDRVYTNKNEVAVRGRLLREGELLFEFVDVFIFDEHNMSRLQTYTQ
ncbi:nuclear transport factor 2 family protein [Haloquadratum walsbyi]|jgi:hypothetical protein|uniref:SnoaL-like domain-containing protein n=1 Tax=Haloquadratum walsbyi J07HQW2 TaxID=1238425 RepID=U1N075_9EURY|nr:nuclear transport factor 2 family protein [Haloquadratum walsbyi]ERG96189.1 MAG: hypothetical protein J07HQW2_02660 [Haloquadratum walsbyi J07HQW2]